MAVNINTILNWFKTGERPTQSQFWDTWQSFWHKDEIIPQSKIENFSSTLNTKADKGGTLSDKGSIPSAADLNNYTEIGLYFQSSNARAASGVNYPIAKAGKLEVTSTSGFVYQTYHEYGSNNAIFYRTYYASGSPTWSPWKSVGEEILYLGPETDLNDYLQTGNYFQVSDNYASSGDNYPVSRAGKLEVKADSSFVYQTYHAYGPFNNIYFRNRYNTTWYPWKILSSQNI